MSKAAKFQMVDPSQGDVYQHMAAQVNERMGKAVEELAAKHADKGQVQQETSQEAPTGAAYREVQEQQMQEEAERRQRKAEKMRKRREEESEIASKQREERLLQEGDDDDEEIRRLREQRLRQIRHAQAERAENIAKGHGQYTDITQDEFLPAVTESTKVVCHFYHSDFPRCRILDHHLSILAARHVEARFIKINAEKAPFFVNKLAIRSLPTVVTFIDGIAGDRVVGFEGLSDGMPPGKEDEWPTVSLAIRLALSRVIERSNIEGLNQSSGTTIDQKLAEMRLASIQQIQDLDDDDLFGDEDA